MRIRHVVDAFNGEKSKYKLLKQTKKLMFEVEFGMAYA